jgi:monofunctional chorismate mutase
MDELTKLRSEITAIDQEILTLFEKRMALVCQISQIKKTFQLPVTDKEREITLFHILLDSLQNKDLAQYYQELFTTLIKVSKDYQNKLSKK